MAFGAMVALGRRAREGGRQIATVINGRDMSTDRPVSTPLELTASLPGEGAERSAFMARSPLGSLKKAEAAVTGTGATVFAGGPQFTGSEAVLFDSSANPGSGD